jgi:SAM-dependent methyltransferase
MTTYQSKDVIENRRKIQRSRKLPLALHVLRDNGPFWTVLLVSYYVSSYFSPKFANWVFLACDRLRKSRDLPGINSKLANKMIWDNWDWSDQGEEWAVSVDWKRSVINKILAPNIRDCGVVLEIGPGAGRWTIELQKRTKKLIGIDISETSVRECRSRFVSVSNVDFRLGNGFDLEGVPDASIDAIWSFDVFVHINRPELLSYAREFARVLKPGGVDIIHHGSCGGSLGGWRSNVCQEDVSGALYLHELEIEQFSSWLDGGHNFSLGPYGDVITIFRLPSLATQKLKE